MAYNGNIVEYDEENEDEKVNGECASIIQKEIFNFTQKSLDDKGVFMLDFNSESFIWIGKKVRHQDRLFVL